MSDTEQEKSAALASAEPPEIKEPEDPAQIDYQQGRGFFENGDYSQAANAFHNALIGFEQSGNEEGGANANDKLGDICLSRKEYDKALAYFEKARSICQRLDDLMSVLSLKKKIARCYRGRKECEAAAKIYFELLDVYERINNPGSTVDTIILLAETYEESGDLEKAADAYRTAASIHANFNHPKQAKELQDKAAALS